MKTSVSALVFCCFLANCNQTYRDQNSDIRGAVGQRFIALKYYQQEHGDYPKSIDNSTLRSYLADGGFDEFQVGRFDIQSIYKPADGIIIRFKVRDGKKKELIWVIDYDYNGAHTWRRPNEVNSTQ